MKKLIKAKNDRLSLQQAFHNFLTLKKSEGRTQSTLNSYSTQLSCFFSCCTDKKISFVDQITKSLVDEYRVHLLNRADITQDTRASYVRALKSFVSYLVSAEELDDFKIPNFPIASKTSVSTYSDEEIKQLLSCPWSKSKDFSEQRDYVMMLTLFLTGARRSTVRAMRIDDVNFEDKLLTLRHIKRDTTFQIRQVPLNSDLKTAISKYLRKTGLWGQSEYLFPNVEGGLLHVDTINKRMEKLFTAAGVEFRGCHEFRRTYATKTYAALGDIEQTRKLMMISDPRVLRLYVNTDKDFLECRKRELGIANSDILIIFNNLVGRVITDATLRRKLAGKSDFTATEILVLAIILEMSPREIIEYFHLMPNT